MRRVLCLLLFIGTPSGAWAVPPFPGGILDPSGRTAYLSSEVGLDAVDLTRGDVVWRSKDAHVPMLVAGDRLFALGLCPTNQLSVLAFDLASKSERVFKTDVTSFPRWVTTRGGEGQSFQCTWRQTRNTLFLDWQASARTRGSPAKEALGQLRVDLDTGRVRPSEVVLASPRPTVNLPRTLEKQAVRWKCQVGGQLLAGVLEDLPESRPGLRRQRMVLRGWDVKTGKEGPPRELLRGQRLVVLAGLENKHLWVRDAGGFLDGQGPSGQSAQHHWSVYSVLDGHLEARVPYIPGTRLATIIEQRAYCLSAAPARVSFDRTSPPRMHSLVAIDLENGKVLWRHGLGCPIAGR